MSVSICGDDIVKVRACWHKVYREINENKKKVISAEDSLSVAAEQLALELKSKKKPNFKLHKANLCYYGFHETGKNKKIFIPAWRFRFEFEDENGIKYYNIFVNAHNNEVVDLKKDLSKAIQKHK